MENIPRRTWLKLARLIHSLWHKEFVKGVAVLMSGNIAAQLIILCSAPVLTRLFEPDVFGMFALYFAMVAIISKVGTLCYERAIVLPETSEAAVELAVISLIVLCIIAVIVGLMSYLLGAWISDLLGSPGLRVWLYAVPAGIVLMSAANILRYWALRHKRLSLISRASVWDAFVSSSIKIGFGVVVGSWMGGLVFGAIAGSIVSILVLAARLCETHSKVRARRPLLEGLKESAGAYKSFPLYASWNAFVNIISIQVVVFILSILFGPIVVGFYSLSSRVMRQPIAAVSQTVSTMYLQKSAEQVANNVSVLEGLKKTTLGLVLIGGPPILLLALYADDIFAFVFGAQWEEAGLYVKALSPWFFFLFIGGPAKMIYEVRQKQAIRLIINGLTAVFRVTAMMVAYMLFKTPFAVIVALSIASTVMEIWLLTKAISIASSKVCDA